MRPRKILVTSKPSPFTLTAEANNVKALNKSATSAKPPTRRSRTPRIAEWEVELREKTVLMVFCPRNEGCHFGFSEFEEAVNEKVQTLEETPDGTVDGGKGLHD